MGVLDKIMLFAAGKEAKNDLPKTQNPNLRKVFVVEGDPNLKTQYVSFLPPDQFEVKTAENGAEALNVILTFRPDFVLIDLNLPVMNGQDLLHHMRAIPEYKTTPVLVVADKGDIDTIRQVKLYDGAKGFLIKENVTPQQTIATLLDLL